MPTFFVVLGLHRTGSNLLISALDAHRQVVVSGELFMEHERSRRMYGTTAQGEFYRDGTDGATFLDQHVFGAGYPPGTEAVGFKLFFNHATTDPAATVWQRLAQDPSVRVIRVQRKNLLDVYLSNEIALRTGEWWCSPKQKPTLVPPFPLSASMLERFFEYASSRERWADEAFRIHASIVVQYERDLMCSYDTCMVRVQSFLNLTPQGTPPRIRKQAVRSALEQISNYQELQRIFEGSEYTKFFDL